MSSNLLEDLVSVRLPKTKSGFLKKKSPSLFGHWQNRFFILKEKKLKWYKTEADFNSSLVPLGVINFD